MSQSNSPRQAQKRKKRFRDRRRHGPRLFKGGAACHWCGIHPLTRVADVPESCRHLLAGGVLQTTDGRLHWVGTLDHLVTGDFMNPPPGGWPVVPACYRCNRSRATLTPQRFEKWVAERQAWARSLKCNPADDFFTAMSVRIARRPLAMRPLLVVIDDNTKPLEPR